MVSNNEERLAVLRLLDMRTMSRDQLLFISKWLKRVSNELKEIADTDYKNEYVKNPRWTIWRY